MLLNNLLAVIALYHTMYHYSCTVYLNCACDIMKCTCDQFAWQLWIAVADFGVV